MVPELNFGHKTINLGLFRSDYMVHVDPDSTDAIPELRQVEFNTIASSFGGLAEKVSELHLYGIILFHEFDTAS